MPVSWQRSAAAEGRRSKCRAQAHRCVCQVHVVRQVYVVCQMHVVRQVSVACATGVGCMPRRFRSCSMSDWSSACRSASRRRACAISHHGCRDAVQREPRPSARKEARRWPFRAHRRFGRVRALELPLELRELQGAVRSVGARQTSRRRNGRPPQAIGRRRLCLWAEAASSCAYPLNSARRECSALCGIPRAAHHSMR